MRKRPDLFTAGMAAAGSLLLLFVLLPLLSVFLGTSPAALLDTLGDAEVQRSLLLTFGAGALATLLGLLTGVPLAYLLARKSFPGKRVVEGLVDLPVVIPHTAAGIALLAVFGARGWIGAPLASVGVYFVDSLPGIVVGMLFVSLPFLVNSAREAFALVDPELEKVAETMGAAPGQAFIYITLPLAWRGVFAGALMMWARGISEFGAVVILAYHPQIVPVLVYERFQGFGLNAARPVAALLIIAALVVFAMLRAFLVPRRGAPSGEATRY